MSNKQVAFYDDPSFNYQKYWVGREYEDKSDKIALQRLLSLIPKGGTLLDIGGGFGRLVPEYTKRFDHCLLIDPSDKLLKEARNLCRKYKNLRIKKGYIESLPLKNNSFEKVLVVRTLHHLENPVKAIKEIYRVLKPNGYLILEFANKIRFKSLLKAFFKLNFDFLTSHRPLDISRKEGVAPFFSYHPSHIKTLLLANKFRILKVLSVSNLRNPWIKKITPLHLLLKIESLLSKFFSSLPIFRFYGPSIFILAQKR